MVSVQHPGRIVREEVLPKGMSVTKAAEIVGIGRPAFSNFLNGRSALSRDLAARLNKAFGVDAEELMRRQAEYDSVRRGEKASISSTTHTFVPPFLEAKADDIEQWADRESARGRLAVFLRMLVNSTCSELEFVDFPGNDDAQRPGLDGRVQTANGSPWVPQGNSSWEFGTNRQIARKADGDYAKRTASTDPSERGDTTFVFVTPRRWHNKERWLSDKRAEGNWKGVWAWDSSDLEQWLEQSIAAQAWFENQHGRNLLGVKSLDKCWQEWCADCQPRFTEQIFDEAISTWKDKPLVAEHLRNPTNNTLRIVADSRQEGLAFLHALLADQEQKSREIRDKAVVFTKPGPLSELAVGSPGFLPIIAHQEVERELAESGCELGGFVIEPRTAHRRERDDSIITLAPLSSRAFGEALATMGLNREAVDRLERESGKSLTVLRRRLARSAELRSPRWSADPNLARALFPLMLAGAWKARNGADLYMLSVLSGCDDDYEELRRRFNRLENLEDAPVWTTGAFQGVVSKIDTLYAVHSWVTADQVSRFMTVAGIVLSERDPSIDLPEDQAWAAALYGKQRELSPPLRKGIADSLVLLAVHGSRVFDSQPGLDLQREIAALIRDVLEPREPLSPETLQSQSSMLPIYAEAAPEEFLSILERDLTSVEPAVSALMNPVTHTLMGRSDRVHLLWAVEILAWQPELLQRVVAVLAKLADMEPEDNLTNKPSASLHSLFRWWRPQTGASLEHRAAAFDRLVAQHPRSAWNVAKSQFDVGQQWVTENAKPKWRDYVQGYGEPDNTAEGQRFIVHCIETCVDWPEHTWETLWDLLGNAESGVDNLYPQYHARLHHRVSEWCKTADDKARARLRERIRVSMRRRTPTSDATSRGLRDSEQLVSLARYAFEILEPTDLVWKHAWLFQNEWVPESWDELDEKLNPESRHQRLTSLRSDALRQVIADAGYDGVLRVAFAGQQLKSTGVPRAESTTGTSVAGVIGDDEERLAFARTVLDDGDILSSASHQSLIRGFLHALGNEPAFELVESLSHACDEVIGVKLLCLCPFGRPIWTKVKGLGESVSANYWSRVQPVWRNHGAEDINYAVAQLLEVRRAASAMDFAHLDWKHVESDLIRQILTDLPMCREPGVYATPVDRHRVQQALKVLDERRAFGRSEMAELEFLYLDLFWLDKGSALNLEREIEANPELFSEFVASAYKPEKSDPERPFSEGELEMARRAHRVLNMLSRLPGHDEGGKLSANKLHDWVHKARDLCRAKGRGRMGDQCIGRLLSHSPDGTDGIWPCEPVRDVLDSVLKSDPDDDIRIGFQIGRRNSRGAHWLGEGGDQERDLAAQYDRWAKACDYRFSQTATVLRDLSEGYRKDARWQDREAAEQRRLGY